MRRSEAVPPLGLDRRSPGQRAEHFHMGKTTCPFVAEAAKASEAASKRLNPGGFSYNVRPDASLAFGWLGSRTASDAILPPNKWYLDREPALLGMRDPPTAR